MDFGTPKVTTMNVRVNLLAIFVLAICSTCAHAQFDTVINLPEDLGSPNPNGFSGNSIGTNTQLNLSDGGSIGFGFDAGARDVSSTNVEVNISGGTIGNSFGAFGGSTINVSGGRVGSNFTANSGSTVNISGGSVGSAYGSDFDAESGSTVNITGGEVGSFFDANDGSEVNISGGTVGLRFDAFAGSTVDISGGTVGDSFTAFDGSTVNISGGSVGTGFNAASGSTVSISGGQFSLMGVQLMILPRLLPLVMEMFLLER